MWGEGKIAMAVMCAVRNRRLAGLVGAVAIGATASAALPAAAAAAPGWVTPVGALSTATGSQFQPAVAVDSKGDTVVVWTDASQNVWESERPVGGVFSVGSQIDTNPTDVNQVFGSVAIDDSGLIYVFYVIQSSDATKSQPVVATRLIGGSTWTVTPLAPANSTNPPSAPYVGAVTPSGKAVAVWEKDGFNGAEHSILQFSTKAAGSSTWSPGADVTNTGDQFDLSHPGNAALAIDPSGDAALVFQRVGESAVWGTTLTSGSTTWTSANKMSTFGLQMQPVVAIDSGGNATAVWLHRNGSNNIVQFATKALSASSWPTAPQGNTTTPGANDLSPLGTDASQPAVAIEPDGTTTIAWAQAATTEQERTRPAGSASFNSATTLATTLSFPTPPVLVAGGDGDMFALWSGQNGSSASVVSAAWRDAGATSFSSLADLPGTGNSIPAAAPDNLGNVSVAWVNSPSAGMYRNQATGLEAPTISNITFPTTATLGESFSYSATVSDRWATPTSSVNFGDGSSGPLSGTKSYASAGTFNAMFLGTDPFGSATVTKTITVPSPSTGGGGGGTGGGGGSAGGGGNTLQPPNTKLLKATINHHKHSAAFKFNATGTVTGFKCALVKQRKHKKAKPRFSSCRSPKTYKHLKKGRYKFFVEAVNAAGVDLSPSTRTFGI